MDDLSTRCNVVNIDSWADMKVAFKAQFGLENLSWVTYNQLMVLKFATRLQAQVKTYIGLMLEITDISKEDSLYHFMKGLQPWAHKKLHHKNVHLATTIAITGK